MFTFFISILLCRCPVLERTWNEVLIERMEKRAARVSEAQWNILLDFLERNPNLARARGYNNSARGRAESLRLWQEVADLLNAEGSGTTKSPKDWSIYVSNYKSKLKKIVADINAEVSGTGGGPSRGTSLTDTENRFLALMGSGFGQMAPRVSVHPFPDLESQQSTTLEISNDNVTEEDQQDVEIEIYHVEPAAIPPVATAGGSSVPALAPTSTETPPLAPTSAEVPPSAAPLGPTGGGAAPPASLPRQTRRTRLRSRPLAPLDEARRILSQVEMQRAAADAASARAIQLIGQNLGRIADALERYLSLHGSQ